jgi:hypothetical protein
MHTLHIVAMKDDTGILFSGFYMFFLSPTDPGSMVPNCINCAHDWERSYSKLRLMERLYQDHLYPKGQGLTCPSRWEASTLDQSHSNSFFIL